METANSLVRDALAEILVQPAEQPVQAVDFQTGVRYLNRMMAMWDADGISLGYTQVVNSADPITVPAGAISGMLYNLALLLAPQYGMQINPELRSAANQGLNAIRKIAVKIQPTVYPCTLPIGSGNEGNTSYNIDHFHPCESDNALTEREGTILLESNTND